MKIYELPAAVYPLAIIARAHKIDYNLYLERQHDCQLELQAAIADGNEWLRVHYRTKLASLQEMARKALFDKHTAEAFIASYLRENK